MSSLFLVTLAVVGVFMIGILIGTSLTTRAQDDRDRRQAAIQRRLNDQARVLREVQHTRHDYEITNEVPRR